MSLHTANLGIMSAAKFTNATLASQAVGGIAGKLKGRGSNMSGIDVALKVWEKNCTSQTMGPTQKAALVSNINYECENWLNRKRDKTTTICTHRKQVITNLKLSIRAPLQFLTKKSIASTGGQRFLRPRKQLAPLFRLSCNTYVGESVV